MNTCHHVPDDSDIIDALLKIFSHGNLTFKLYCVCTDSRKKNLGTFHSLVVMNVEVVIWLTKRRPQQYSLS
jgi:hypothetical protein